METVWPGNIHYCFYFGHLAFHMVYCDDDPVLMFHCAEVLVASEPDFSSAKFIDN